MEDPPTRRKAGTRSTVALALATAAGNILAYAFTIAMSRLLGLRDFGELGTLLGIWLIAQIPAVACQLTAARAVAAAAGASVAGPAGAGAGAAAAGVAGPGASGVAVAGSGAAGAGAAGAGAAAAGVAGSGASGVAVAGSGAAGAGAAGAGAAAAGVAGSEASGVGALTGAGLSAAEAAVGGATPMLWLGVRVGAAGAAALAVAGLPLAAVLHVGIAAAAWLAVGQLPLTVLFAALGVLQGRSAFGLFGGLLAGFQALRLVAGGAAATAGLGPAGVLAATAAASLVAAGGGWWLASRVAGSAGGRRPPRHWGTLLRGSASMGALMLLTTTDLLLAGHFLTGDARGVYASGNVLTRIAFWGPQFIGTLAYPRLVRPTERERARRLALLAVGGLAAVGMVIALLAGRPLVVAVFGPAYRPLGPLAPLFVAVGAAAAVINLVLLDDVATGRTLGTRLAFVAVAVEVVGVALWWHDSPAHVVTVAALACSAAAALAVAVTSGRAPAGPGGRRRMLTRAAPAQRLP